MITTNRRIKGNKRLGPSKHYKELDGFKFNKRTKRLLCDVEGCTRMAYAELYRLKDGWMYVCKSHYTQKINKRTGKPKEPDLGFCLLRPKERYLK